MIEYIDIHCHTNFSAFNSDREEVVSRTLDSGVAFCNVGTQKDTSKSAVELASKYEKDVYAIIGLHPIHTYKSYHDKQELGEGNAEFTSRGEVFDYLYYQALSLNPKVIAIGECGLDYFRLENNTKEKQKEAFIGQIALANEINKPLMLHIREAYEDAYEILKRESKVRGNLHFFAGNMDQARKFLDLGCTFSFTGVITFARQYDEIIKYLPKDRIMSETDSPYVSPVPHRGKRNEPVYVKEVVKRIAQIRGESEDEMKKVLLKNAGDMFGVGY